MIHINLIKYPNISHGSVNNLKHFIGGLHSGEGLYSMGVIFEGKLIFGGHYVLVSEY